MTDFCDTYSINHRLSNSTFELAVNKLPVNLLDFALISGMRHRVYGARILPDEVCEAGCLNQLARQELWRILFNIQQMLISQKHFIAGTAYIHESKFIDHATRSFHTKFPSLESVNVIEQLTFLVNLHISPYIIHDVEVVLDATSTFWEAHFNKTLAQNPKEVMLRDFDTDEQFDWQEVSQYPDSNAYDWIMPIGNAMTTSNTDYAAGGSKQAALQHYELMMAEIPTISGTSLDDIVALHPNSNQILPFAKPPEEVIVDGEIKWRFWFYSWMMGRPEHSGETLDLVAGEFYKLYDTIELFVRSEVTQNGLIHYRKIKDNCLAGFPEYTYASQATPFTLLDPESGAVTYDSIADDISYVPHQRYRSEVYYKINPFQDTLLFSNAIEESRRAIAAKTAATINLESCGCKPKIFTNPGEGLDFIAEMQKDYTIENISALTGSVAVNYRYGHRHGDFIFAEMMDRIQIRPRVFVI